MPEEIEKTEETKTDATTDSTQTEETTAAEATEETTETAPGPSQEELNQAMSLYRALSDPEIAPSVIKVMAEKLGISMEAKREEAKKPTARDIINKSLGKEYEFLGDKLAPALEEYIHTVLAPFEQRIVKSSLQAEFERASDRLNNETKGDFKKVEKEIIQLMDRVKPADGISVQDYLTDLYTLAKAGRGQKELSKAGAKAVVDRIAANAQERLPSPSAASEVRLVKGPARPTLDEAIAAAIRGERFGG